MHMEQHKEIQKDEDKYKKMLEKRERESMEAEIELQKKQEAEA